MKSNDLGFDTDKKRIILELFRHKDLKEVFERLHRKTGMRSSIDIVRMALTQLDSNLPEAPAARTVNA